MFGLPSLQAIIAYGTVPVLIAFAIVNYRQTWYSVMMFIVVCLNTFYGIWFYMAFMYEDWKRTESTPKSEPVREQLKYRDMSEPEYAVDTEVVTLDVERNFFAWLGKQLHDRNDYKLTEDWLYKHIWHGIGGSSKPQLQKALQKWEGEGLLKKANPLAKNSTRVVGSRRLIVERAHGRKQ